MQQARQRREGVARGLFANKESSARVLAMVRTQVDQPIDAWPMFAAAERYAKNASPEAASIWGW